MADKGTVFSHTTVQHVKTDETKDPDIADNVKAYTYTLYENISDLKYTYTESDFDGFFVDDYLSW